MSVLTRSALSASPLADLHLIAGELGLDGYRRLRKAELVDRILERSVDADENPSDADTDPSDPLTVDETASAASSGSGRRRRRRRRDADADPSDRLTVADETPAKSLTVAETDESVSAGRQEAPADADTDPSDPLTVDETASAVSSGPDEDDHRRGAKRQPSRDRQRTSPDRDGEEERTVEGVIELQSGGAGLVKAEDGGPDVYVSAAQVRRCELVDGDRVSGPVRPARRSERHPSLARVEQINGRSADEVSEGTPYDAIPCGYPTERIELADPALKAVSETAPFGRGSRVTITGAAMSGKTELLRAIAASLRAADGLEVLTVLAGSRPEEASSWKETEVDLHATVALPAAPEARARAVEGAVEAGRRMAARGQDVAVLIDTLDGLDRGVVRRSLGAARNLTESGSLTVIATAAAPIGGETTVIALDRAQAAAGQYPALDTQGSGTIKAELLS